MVHYIHSLPHVHLLPQKEPAPLTTQPLPAHRNKKSHRESPACSLPGAPPSTRASPRQPVHRWIGAARRFCERTSARGAPPGRKCATGFLLFRHRVRLWCNRQRVVPSLTGSSPTRKAANQSLTEPRSRGQTTVSETKPNSNQSVALMKPSVVV